MVRVNDGESGAHDRFIVGDTTGDALSNSDGGSVAGAAPSLLGVSLIVAIGALLVMRFLLHSRPDGLGIIGRHAGEIRDIVYSLAYGSCLILFWGAVICVVFAVCSLIASLRS